VASEFPLGFVVVVSVFVLGGWDPQSGFTPRLLSGGTSYTVLAAIPPFTSYV